MDNRSHSVAIRKPYLLILGDMANPTFAKTAFGLRDWSRNDCIGQLRFSAQAVDLGLPEMTVLQARAAGAATAVIGITPPGGRLPPAWIDTLLAAMDAGMDIASGLHLPLHDIPALASRAGTTGRRLHNVRLSDAPINVGTGARRTGKRMLMVGTDCAVGKKYTALAITRALLARGMKATFRATGQTGILIAGQGIAVDAVKADFVSGAAEALSPDNDPDHWDIIEGQGSLFHPSFAAVTLGLIHGSQPDLMVLCHRAGRTAIAGVDGYACPDWAPAISLYRTTARLTNPGARVAALSVNCGGQTPDGRAAILRQTTKDTGMFAFDPMVTDFTDDLLAIMADV